MRNVLCVDTAGDVLAVEDRAVELLEFGVELLHRVDEVFERLVDDEIGLMYSATCSTVLPYATTPDEKACRCRTRSSSGWAAHTRP